MNATRQKRKARIRDDWPKEWPVAFLRPGDVVYVTEDDGDLTDLAVFREGQPIRSDDLSATELGAALGKYGETDETHAASYVGEAMRSRLDDLAALVAVANGEGDHVDEQTRLNLDIHLNDYDDEREAADERLIEYPLCVEATTTFEVVLGTGGPDDRLCFECDVYDDSRLSDQGHYSPTQYEIRRVLYRYSWTGSAEVELVGEDRETAEAFARRVVPELAE